MHVLDRPTCIFQLTRYAQVLLGPVESCRFGTALQIGIGSSEEACCESVLPWKTTWGHWVHTSGSPMVPSKPACFATVIIFSGLFGSPGPWGAVRRAACDIWLQFSSFKCGCKDQTEKKINLYRLWGRRGFRAWTSSTPRYSTWSSGVRNDSSIIVVFEKRCLMKSGSCCS